MYRIWAYLNMLKLHTNNIIPKTFDEIRIAGSNLWTGWATPLFSGVHKDELVYFAWTFPNTVGNLGVSTTLCMTRSPIQSHWIVRQCPRESVPRSKNWPRHLPGNAMPFSWQGSGLFRCSWPLCSNCPLGHSRKQWWGPLWWSIVNPPARISMDRDALVGTRCELRAVTTAKPWIIRVVFANRGLLNDENSFAAIHWLLGHECRWAPIESKIIVIWHDPNVVALSLETARAPQYSWRSLNCRRRWRWSISCWARRAGGQCPSFFMIRRCFTHWEQREWCEKKRILKRCSKSVCQTWSWTSMEPNSFLFNGWLPKE